MKAADLFALALTDELRAKDFMIYSHGGWCAWNAKTREMVNLRGPSFSEAVDDFERRIGPYYATRNLL